MKNKIVSWGIPTKLFTVLWPAGRGGVFQCSVLKLFSLIYLLSSQALLLSFSQSTHHHSMHMLYSAVSRSGFSGIYVMDLTLDQG